MIAERTRCCFQVTAIIVLISVGTAFEFDKDSCETLLPIAKLHEVRGHSDNGHSVTTNDELENEDNSQEDNDAHEDEIENDYRLKLALNEDNPFKIVVHAAEYRRNHPVEVTIEGNEFNTFILQARSKLASMPKPLGNFYNAPASVTFMNCFHAADTATAKDSGGKENLRLHWKAPEEDKGTIAFFATIVQKDKFWFKVMSEHLTFNQFPPSISGCGVTKSCYRYSSSTPNCMPDQCDYAVFAQVTEENEIEFTIGGIVKENSGYIGIGFTMDKVKMSFMDVSACVKRDNRVQARQFLVEDWKSGPVHHSQILVHEESDVDGDNIWCQFRRPLHVPGPHTADLRQSLFHVYLWGSIDETTELPVLPPTSEAVLVTEPWNHTNTLNVMHFVGSNACQASEQVGLVIAVAILIAFHG